MDASSEAHLRMSGGKTRGKQPRDAAEDALLLQALHHSHREATRLLLMAVREGATDAQIADALRQGLPHLKRFAENDLPTIATPQPPDSDLVDRQEHENVGGTVRTHPTHANSDADTAVYHGLYHQGIVIGGPELECPCDYPNSNGATIPSNRERGGSASSRGGPTC